jgi:hypothetical protein
MFTHRLIGARRVAGPAALAGLLAIAALPALVLAQGGMGGGMGGLGGPGGMGGGRGHGNHGMSSNSSAPDVSKHFEEMASLKDALKHVDGLTGDQKQSLQEIEHGYTKSFKALGHEAQDLVDSAHVAQVRPDPVRMDTLRQQAKQFRTDELGAAREILTTDTQRDQFDKNVAQIQADEAKHEQDMQQRMSPGGPPAPPGSPPGAPSGGPGEA